MSAPAANTLSPPVSTMQPMPSSASKSCSAAPSSSINASLKALRNFGRVSVITPTLPCRSIATFLSVMRCSFAAGLSGRSALIGPGS